MNTLPWLRSFRVRMTLLSVTLSAAVLILFAGFAWSRVHAAGLARIDEQIRLVGDRQLMRPPHEQGQWRRVEQMLGDLLGGGEDDSFLLYVKDWEDYELHRSASWPEAIPVEDFPTPIGPPDEFHRRGPGGRFGRGGPPPWEREDASPDRDGGIDRPHDEWDRESPPYRDGPRGRGGPPGRGPHGPPPAMRVRSIETIDDGENRWRLGVMTNDRFTMVFGVNLNAFDADLRRARNLFVLSMIGALSVVVAGSSWLAGRALRPVTALTETAEKITAHGLDQRIDVGKADAEFERLIGVFNDMLARLNQSFSQAVRFSADAAHELKTPLTVLQGELESALQDAAHDPEAQRQYSRLLDEVQRLKTITRKLLLLSLADTGQLKLNKSDVDLSAMAEAAADDIEVLAPNLRVDHQIDPKIHIHADPDLIRQVVQNLASNAAKYTDEAGRVRIQLRRNGTFVKFSIVNTGPGIPPEERERVFDRFYRADKSRARTIEGAGLGLSLAREIARAHGGDLVLEDSKPIVTKFALTLPIE
jgi:two-component system, OmpR family, heavy metal sensor histidine kinase CusS